MNFKPIQTPRQSDNFNTWVSRLVDVLAGVETYTVTTGTVASISANTTAEESFTVTGLKADSILSITKPTHQAGLGIVNARATANTLLITYMNTTGAGIVPTDEDYLITAIRR